MSRVGLVGGLGPEATLDYYRRLVYAWRREDPLSSPSIVIDSVDDKVAIRLVEHDRPALTEYVLESLHRLHGAGVISLRLPRIRPTSCSGGSALARSAHQHCRRVRGGGAAIELEAPRPLRDAVRHGSSALSRRGAAARYSDRRSGQSGIAPGCTSDMWASWSR